MSLVNLRIYRIGQLVGLKFPLPGFQQFGQLVPLTVLFINLKKHNAGRVIPIGILGSISACGILGTIIIIVTLFCIQTDDIEGHILGSKFGQPMAQSFTMFWVKVGIILYDIYADLSVLMGSSILTAISRQIWAFSRDNGLPFSFWIKRVNKICPPY